MVRTRSRGHLRAARRAARTRLPRGRDADAAAGPRRRQRPPVRHPQQRLRHAALPAHRAGAVPQAARRRRGRAGLRDRPQLPQRGRRRDPQPRVHDAGGVRGVRRLHHHAGAGPRADPGRGRRPAGAAPRRPSVVDLRDEWPVVPVYTAVSQAAGTEVTPDAHACRSCATLADKLGDRLAGRVDARAAGAGAVRAPRRGRDDPPHVLHRLPRRRLAADPAAPRPTRGWPNAGTSWRSAWSSAPRTPSWSTRSSCGPG